MYRLDVFTPRGGWHTVALGQKFKALEEYGYNRLQPAGAATAYRVRKARKADLDALKWGAFQEREGEEGVFIRAI